MTSVTCSNSYHLYVNCEYHAEENTTKQSNRCLVTIRCSLKITLFSSLSSQDKQEDVDDVQVQVQRRKDVLLRADRVLMLAAHHDLGVVHEVQ